MGKGRRGKKNKAKMGAEKSPAIGKVQPPASDRQKSPSKKKIRHESVTMKGRAQSYAPRADEDVAKARVAAGGGASIGGRLGKSSGLTSLQERMRAKLEGGKFRMLNEQLYTTTGREAFESFSKDPKLFDIYHRGFREQVEKWPQNPLDLIISWLALKYPKAVVADFGCGDAQLAEKASRHGATIHSFDLVSVNDRVTACDMSNVPLGDASVDVAVFCLSLMGTNLADYLREARRILKPGAILKVRC